MSKPREKKVKKESASGDEDWTASQEEGPVVQNASNKKQRELKSSESESGEKIAVADKNQNRRRE